MKFWPAICPNARNAKPDRANLPAAQSLSLRAGQLKPQLSVMVAGFYTRENSGKPRLPDNLSARFICVRVEITDSGVWAEDAQGLPR